MYRASSLLSIALIAILILPSACAGQDCKSHDCAGLVSSSTTLSTNGKKYTECFVGSDPLETILKDDSQSVFFDCTDAPGKSCLDPAVNAEFAYCDVH